MKKEEEKEEEKKEEEKDGPRLSKNTVNTFLSDTTALATCTYLRLVELHYTNLIWRPFFHFVNLVACTAGS